MSVLDQRVIYDQEDISLITGDFRSQAGEFTFNYTIDKYLYVAASLPFNNLWFDLGTPNDVPAQVFVDIFWGNSWVPAIDILDSTFGLTQSGRLQWNTNYQRGWSLVQRPFNQIPDLSFEIYNMYWLRLSWDAAFNPNTTIKYIGQKFSNDTVLASFYPDLLRANVMAAFSAGKTNWDEQHYMAAEHIVRDLKKRGIIMSRGQILDAQMLQDASCHRVAELIYTSFGKPYYDQMRTAQAAYDKAMNVKYFNMDIDADGRLDPAERFFMSGFMRR